MTNHQRLVSFFALIFVFFVLHPVYCQTEPLRKQIEAIVKGKQADVGVAIDGPESGDTLTFQGSKHYPMQSVFKFPIALVVLSQVDKGKFSLNQKIKILKKDLLPGLYSPIREKYPEGATLTLAEILEYTVSQSDNVGCDALLRLIGGPQVVEDYFVKNNFKDISIKINEEVMQGNWDLQFQNWTTPKEANRILAAFHAHDQKFLSKQSYDFVWKVMKQTETGKDRLKGQLPKGTVVAHKTGWSGMNKAGVTAATNNIGVVYLPQGKHFYISVFVANSTESPATNEKIIADIAKAAWDYFTAKEK
jgi:beta-lactamase class A/beta-lactamase class A VEB